MIFAEDELSGLSTKRIKDVLKKTLAGKTLGKVLLVPPDITRLNSGAGLITALYYDLLGDANVDILPALGTHAPMTREEQVTFFGSKIPAEKFLVHNWREGVTKIGEVPAAYIKEISEGHINAPIDVEISNHLLNPDYDLILSIGQVVPHEVAGMANYTKNIAIGCGGSGFINSSHMLGAVFGLERVMGKDHSPVRKALDYAEDSFISKLPLEYVLTVTVSEGVDTDILGLYAGKGREVFERAVRLSQKHNVHYLEAPLKTCVVRLDEREFRSTWLGNKAIYRTRMAMAGGGSLIILAPGVCRFGEDAQNDKLIRKYGYIGRENILRLCESEADLKSNLSAAAHLIHGSAEGRFKVIYAAGGLSKSEVEGVGFAYMPYEEALARYAPANTARGFNTLPDGEEIYYIDDPAVGLWTTQENRPPVLT
ncbi:MAG: lactate racemase domain-containing protein [Oscillospiraceae bacterium]|nr:lactate racemase domain-containing protein [Oscillospiraceae bacterium]